MICPSPSNSSVEMRANIRSAVAGRPKDPTYNRRFVIGVDRTKMRLYDCEQSAQDDLLDTGQDVEYNDDDKTTKKFAEFKF